MSKITLTQAERDQAAKQLRRLLDAKAQGADEVVYRGLTFVRRGPRTPTGQPGPWRLVK